MSIEKRLVCNAQTGVITEELFEHTPPTPPTYEEKLAVFEVERDRRLAECDFITLRHQEQKQLGIPTTKTEAEYLQWLQYKQDLRDMTKQSGFDPGNPAWPMPPGPLK